MRLILYFLAAVGGLCAQPVAVMSFNVRFPSKDDGSNVWEMRKDLLVETVRRRAPDLMGTQELFQEQGDYIVEKLPQYAWFGVSRRGSTVDEHMGVFYRKDKLMPESSGNFWLSETPDVAGSSAWEMSLPRMVTWAVFAVKSSGRRFLYFNTHFPHRRQDEAARVNCAKLIRDEIGRRAGDLPFLMTGDFNAPAEGQVHKTFVPHLKDVWREAPKRSGPEGTFHGFTGTPGNARIDWILYRGPWTAVEVATLTDNDGGRYPSDHFPVLAKMELR
jgi:endonuclease/exonuclease/phosphatase family metal-dependent hydrolase